ncbi:cell wall protein [Trichoderma citrinoviride]|uniref:Cell wall protein n=1 Tax=Trichoderma citrinoviride TaxID=58853 RepID=A0A2T4B8D5_9HYPO|nr:cell wall protein [Trichoderma citrinoviride]PTB65586.1 cell wall protein [Trichoderma citrinoviride]
MQPYVFLALLGSVAVDAALAPRADCAPSFNGQFQVTVAKTNKRDLEKRDCSNPNALLLTLNNGILKDAKGRTGYIASNFQWQFDNPPQANALVTSGFSACDNALGLKGSTTFWQCLSGDFYNLYDRNWAPQCQPVELVILPCGGSSAGHSNKGSGAEGGSGGSGASGVNQAVTAISDGQPQAPISQKTDGQPQVPPVTQISDGQPQGPTGSPAPPVTQISDGQPQGPTGSPAPPVTQISDGQPQGPTGSPAPPVTQISDGQPQGPTGSPAPPVTQISDGQPQVPTGSAKPPVAPVGTGTGVPSSPSFAPTQPPISGSSKVIPGLSVAVAVALVGMVAL